MATKNNNSEIIDAVSLDVKMCSFFEDSFELPVMEQFKQRKAITEYECPYQIVKGVEYLYKNKIMRRPLKLESLFLNDMLQEVDIRLEDLNYCSHLKVLYQQLAELIHSKPNLFNEELFDSFTDPAAQPLYWISKFVEHKCGFGYQLNDETIGVLWKDKTQIIKLPNQIDVHYIESNGKKTYMTTTNYCNTFNNKMRVFGYFTSYMNKYLARTGPQNADLKSNQMAKIPHLKAWFHTNSASAMFLTNGTVQFNFTDHVKVILCSHKNAITYLDKEQHLRTYRAETLMKHGCAKKDLFEKLIYIHAQLGQMLEKIFFYDLWWE